MNKGGVRAKGHTEILGRFGVLLPETKCDARTPFVCGSIVKGWIVIRHQDNEIELRRPVPAPPCDTEPA